MGAIDNEGVHPSNQQEAASQPTPYPSRYPNHSTNQPTNQPITSVSSFIGSTTRMISLDAISKQSTIITAKKFLSLCSRSSKLLSHTRDPKMSKIESPRPSYIKHLAEKQASFTRGSSLKRSSPNFLSARSQPFRLLTGAERKFLSSKKILFPKNCLDTEEKRYRTSRAYRLPVTRHSLSRSETLRADPASTIASDGIIR